MKNFVFRLVLVMMMVFGVMSMIGCPTDGNETKEPVNPYEGLTVAEQYWGDYKDEDGNFIKLREKGYFFTWRDNGLSTSMNDAYTVDTDNVTNLIGYFLDDNGTYSSYYFGRFPDNQTFIREDTPGNPLFYFIKIQ